MSKSFHASVPLHAGQPNPLGLLADLPGRWIGSGFNLIARPDKQDDKPFVLELNTTSEVLEFTSLGGEAANRGSLQNDIDLFGVRYLQQVTDPVLGKIHLEPGLWMRVPPTTVPNVSNDTYVRQAVIPHGDALLAQSTFVLPATPNGQPVINPVDSTPFTGAVPDLNASAATPVTNPAYLTPYLNDLLPAGLPSGLSAAATIKDPTRVLAAQIDGQTIKKTIVIQISTVFPGGAGNILNIPFVTQNANAAQMDAIFWIETVERPTTHREFLQLQYVQRVILDFPPAPGAPIIRWPHISVATLIKQ